MNNFSLRILSEDHIQNYFKNVIDICLIEKTNFSHFFNSGLTIFDNYKVQELNEVTSTSNTVLLYFYSDLAYNMSGFNISYRQVTFLYKLIVFFM